jgi:hypothetical protein
LRRPALTGQEKEPGEGVMAQNRPLENISEEPRKDKIFYIMFSTFYDVLKAEELLNKHHLDVEIVPVPKGLRSDCGACIKSRSPVELLFGLLGQVTGVRCYVFDGVEYKPGRSRKPKAQ